MGMTTATTTPAALKKLRNHFAIAGRREWSIRDYGSESRIVTWGHVDPEAIAQDAADELAEIYSENATESSLARVTMELRRIGASRELSQSERWSVSATAEVHPPEPCCTAGHSHTWEPDGSPWDCGAGVRYVEHCKKCSQSRITRTNQQDGNSQWFDAVSYSQREID